MPQEYDKLNQFFEWWYSHEDDISMVLGVVVVLVFVVFVLKIFRLI